MRPFGGHAFGDRTAHHRDAYLLALETCALEVSQLSRGLAPYMTSLVCQAPSNDVSGETSTPTVTDLFSPPGCFPSTSSRCF